MRILVTGGTGFVGSAIVDQYVAAGHEVFIIDNAWRHFGNPHAQFYQVDITEQEYIGRVFDEVQPEIVNHQAAQSSVSVSRRDPFLDAQVNILGLMNVLHHCVRCKVRKIIFASSGTVFGTPVQVPVDETLPFHPETPYAITKMAGEVYIRYWNQAYGLTYTILRNSNIYGPRQNPNGDAGVIATFIKRFLQAQPIFITGSGTQQKDYVYVDDVAYANVLALNQGDNDVFCIAAGKGTSVNDIYWILTKVFGQELHREYLSACVGDVPLAYFSSRKAELILGWKAQWNLEDGIRSTVDAFRQQLYVE
jgi:UDP-glucose 4-epimerase